MVVRDAPGALRVDAEGPQPVEPFDQVQEVAGARRAGRRAEPGEAAEPVLGLDLEQRVEPPRAVRVEPVGEARQDLPLGPDEGVGAQALDRARPGDDHPPPADLVEQPAHQLGAGPGLDGVRAEPGLDLGPRRAGEGPEAEVGLQGRGVLVARVLAEGVVDEGFGTRADLLGDEGQGRVRDELAGPEQAPRVAEDAELQGQAEPVPWPTPPPDDREVGLAQGIAPGQLGAVGGQGEERGALRRRQHGTAGHGKGLLDRASGRLVPLDR